MNILITGGAGFIGYHLAQSLHQENHNIICLDNLNDYYDVELKKHRARNLEKKGITVLYHNISYISNIKDQLQNIDCVIHLAAYAGVRHSLNNPQLYIDGNITVTQDLINFCEQMRIPKVIYASTSCVMAGNPLPWDETMNIKHQLNPYGYSKYINECQFKMSKIPCSVGLRFFTVYGPWGRPDMALFSFTNDIINDKEITLFNNGNMIRDFTYVDDIVNGIELIINNDVPNNEIYNIGRGEQVHLIDFVNSIESCLDKKAKYKYMPKHPADTQATWSNTNKLKKLGYNPQVSINEGVKNFISWYLVYYGII